MNSKQEREFEEFMRAVMNSKEADEAYNRMVKSLYELHGKPCPKKALIEYEKREKPEPLYCIMKRIKAGKLTQSEKDLFKKLDVEFNAAIDKYIGRETIFRFIAHVKNNILTKQNTVQILVKPEDLFDYLYTIQRLDLKSSDVNIGPNGENAIITICNSTTEKEKIINLINKL